MKCQEMTGLNAKQTNALNTLVKGGTVSAAAETAGVTERQVYRWLNDDQFNGELKRLKAEMLRLAGVRLASLTIKAIKTLEGLLDAPYMKGDGVRLRTAVAILELVDRWRSTDDFDERLTKLERQVNNVHE